MEEPFDRLVERLLHAVVVVTVAVDGERDGCLVGLHARCSLDPPRYLVCLSVANRTYRTAESATAIAVNFLGRDQDELARLFGELTGDEVDKFTRCTWFDGPRGTPILAEAPGWFVGAVEERHRFGDHVGFVLEPVATGGGGPRSPMMSDHVGDLEAGHDLEP